jgi:hypothetical protein
MQIRKARKIATYIAAILVFGPIACMVIVLIAGSIVDSIEEKRV